jgi:hypothetical protein
MLGRKKLLPLQKVPPIQRQAERGVREYALSLNSQRRAGANHAPKASVPLMCSSIKMVRMALRCNDNTTPLRTSWAELGLNGLPGFALEPTE